MIDIDDLKRDKRPQSAWVVHALIDRLEAAERACDDLRAKIEAMEKQEPVATIHINSITGNPSVYFIPGHRYLHHNSSLYALPGAQPAPNFADAYQGAMEEAAIWKKRALEAEDLNRKFIAEINGPTHMGEPAQPTPSVRDGWKLVPSVPDDLVRGSARLLKRASGHLRWLKKDTYQWQCLNPKTRRAAELLHRDIDAMLAAAPEANQ